MIRIRQAESKDVAGLFELVQHYAAQQALLPRTLQDIRECAGDFWVAEEKGRLLGCGALKLYSRELAEIRSLCIAPGIKRRGIGRTLAKRLLHEARQLNLKTVFALTHVPEFFRKCGFRPAARENFPMKITNDCLNCALYLRCQETAVAISVRARRVEKADVAEPAAVLA